MMKIRKRLNFHIVTLHVLLFFQMIHPNKKFKIQCASYNDFKSEYTFHLVWCRELIVFYWNLNIYWWWLKRRYVNFKDIQKNQRFIKPPIKTHSKTDTSKMYVAYNMILSKCNAVRAVLMLIDVLLRKILDGKM